MHLRLILSEQPKLEPNPLATNPLPSQREALASHRRQGRPHFARVPRRQLTRLTSRVSPGARATRRTFIPNFNNQ